MPFFLLIFLKLIAEFKEEKTNCFMLCYFYCLFVYVFCLILHKHTTISFKQDATVLSPLLSLRLHPCCMPPTPIVPSVPSPLVTDQYISLFMHPLPLNPVCPMVTLQK